MGGKQSFERKARSLVRLVMIEKTISKKTNTPKKKAGKQEGGRGGKG